MIHSLGFLVCVGDVSFGIDIVYTINWTNILITLFVEFSNYLYHYIRNGLVIIFTPCDLRFVDIGLGLAD